MEIISQIFYFIIIIGVLVLVHELGHFLAAKLFRMRVERFSIGFPPRAFGKQIGETDYCVSWLPIGGYVKIAGMVDESLDTGHLTEEPQPWEFRSKPIWQRIIVITAGVIMNILLAIGIFWGLNLARGKEFHQITTIGHVAPKSIAASSGLLPGDKVLSVNNEKITYWEDIEKTIAFKQMAGDVDIEVERDGHATVLSVQRRKLEDLNNQRFGIYPEGGQAVIGMVEPDLPASKAGLQPGDAFVSIDTTRVYSTTDVVGEIGKNAGRSIAVTVERNGSTKTVEVQPNNDGKIGVMLATTLPGKTEIIRYGVFEALGAAVGDLTTITTLTVQNIWHVITGQASFRKSIGGPVKIAEMAAQQAEIGIASFLGLMAILSISLAIINIFPFPALDGGHLIFLLYEAIFRREVPNKIRIVLQQAGMVLLIAFMIFVIYNDIFH